jgi:hypothetical protein
VENDRVITGADGRAVITIFDGSTQVLEPGTDVTLQKLGTNERGGLISSIFQAAGVTWNTVFNTTGQGDAEYSVDTPAAVAAVRDTMFRVSVLTDGTTGVWSRQGTVAVSGQGQETLVANDTYALIASGGSPGDPLPAPTPLSRLRIEQRSGAFLLLVSPDGFVSGLVPPGAPVNQIPLTLISDATSDPQFIELITVLDGTYKLFFQPGDFGDYDLSVFGATNGWPVCAETRKGTIIGGKSGLAQLRLEVRDGALLGCDLGGPVASEETALVNVPDGLLQAVIAGRNLIPRLFVLGAAATPIPDQTPDAPPETRVATQQVLAGSAATPVPTLVPLPPPLTPTPNAPPRATSTPNRSTDTGPANTATFVAQTKTPAAPTAVPSTHTPTRTPTPTATPTPTPTPTSTPVPLVSVDLQPSAGVLRVGYSLQMAAIGTFGDGSTRNITPECVWWSADGFIASVYYNTGIILAYSQGVTEVFVLCADGSSDSATITVSN